MTAKPDLLFIGIGGAGISMAAQAQSALGGRLLHVNRESNSWAHGKLSRALVNFRSGRLPSPEMVEKYLQGQTPILIEEIGEAAIVFIFAGLGGATGTGAVGTVARTCVELDREVHVIVTMPFSYETPALPIAAKGLQRLRADNLRVFMYDHAAETPTGDRSSHSMCELLDLSAARAIAYCTAHVGTLRE